MKNVSLYLSTIVLSLAFLLPTPLVGGAEGEEEDTVFSRAELDQMLAPIALYPDTLLAQILIASTYPLEVVQAARWRRDNPELEGVALANQAEKMGWDPSVQSLTAFPEVLYQMDKDLEWTQRLGEAFLAQEEDVMDAIQGLRERAYLAGTLQEQEHITVRREREIIIIESANPQIIYVPYYQPTVVYGGWWWPSHPAVCWVPPVPVPSRGFFMGFYWGSGVWVSSGFYYSRWHWPSRQIVVNINHYHYGKRHYGTPHYPKEVHRWEHSAIHRRGTPYRSEPLNQRYGRTFVSTSAGRRSQVSGQNVEPSVRTFTPRVRTVEDVRSTLADRPRSGTRENVSARPDQRRGGNDSTRADRERRETRSAGVDGGTRRERGAQVAPDVDQRPQRQTVEGAERRRIEPIRENNVVRRPDTDRPRTERSSAQRQRPEQPVRRESANRMDRRGAEVRRDLSTVPVLPETQAERMERRQQLK